MMRWVGVHLSLLVLGILACGSPEQPPNVVMVLVDDLGWSDVGYNGATFYETPNIDALAAEGMVFRRGYSAGANCAPTRASLLSGMSPPRHHIYTPGGKAKGNPRYMRLAVPAQRSPRELAFPPSRTALPPEVVSLAELLGDAGYETARLGKWHLGPDLQGFDHSSGDGASSPDAQHHGDSLVGDRLTDAALKFIDEQGGRPFFLLLSHWDVHAPFVARPEVVARYRMKLANFEGEEWDPTYAAMIENVDQSIGRIRARLRERGLAQDTLFIFMSDNGGKTGMTPNAVLRGGKGSFLEGGIRVPTVVAWPGQIPAGSLSDVPVTSVDWMPTVAELSGAELPDTQVQPVDGRSLLPLLRGESVPNLEGRPLFWFTPLYVRGSPETAQKSVYGTDHRYWRGVPAAVVMQGPDKLTRFFEDGSVELYDVESDPGETEDRAAREPGRVEELEALLDAWIAETRAPVPTALNPDFDLAGVAETASLLQPGAPTRVRDSVQGSGDEGKRVEGD